MFELVDSAPQSAVIKVVGVGGGGGNAVRHMIDHEVDGVDFICANTDAQALSDIHSKTLLQLGASITKGLGAGANPEVGRAAALEDKDRIADALQGADMVFVTAGMGGGTGTGAAPIVAEVAREMGILTVAVVTRPFSFEGKKRLSIAEEGLKEIAQHCDSLITIPNEKLLEVLGSNTTLLDAFKEANDVLLGAVQGIADLIIRPGLVNVDFADVRTVMSEMGSAMMGTGTASGEGRARDAGLVPPGELHRPRRAGAYLRPGDAVVGAAADFGGGPVPVPGGETAPGGANKAHAERGTRRPTELAGGAAGPGRRRSGARDRGARSSSKAAQARGRGARAPQDC